MSTDTLTSWSHVSDHVLHAVSVPVTVCVCGCVCVCVCMCVPLDIADANNLAPMYKKLHDSIRKYDQKHIILFEPTTIITSVSQGLTQ